eukprot:2998177-Pyramimonas_sp.AAC.1
MSVCMILAPCAFQAFVQVAQGPLPHIATKLLAEVLAAVVLIHRKQIMAVETKGHWLFRAGTGN